MIRLAVVGVGYWGPNLVRNLSQLRDAQLVAICDMNRKRATEIQNKFAPGARLVQDVAELVNSKDIDAVVIATPIRTHFELGLLFLNAGKHVLIEKPLASTVRECERLIDVAEQKKCILMVGHIFEFSTAVKRIKEYLERDELGKLFYVYSQRVNLGRIQNDINALWSFAPHDISILNYWLGAEPTHVSSRGFSCLTNGIEDVIFVNLTYPNGVGCHLHLSWLDPQKVRRMTLVGSKKMIVYDDVSQDAKIQVFDKGVENLDKFLAATESFAEFSFKIRNGDLLIPALPFEEPLMAECRHFVDCIKSSQKPRTDGASGLRVVRVLEAAMKSLQNRGETVAI